MTHQINMKKSLELVRKINERQTKKRRIDKFIEWLDKEEIMLCGIELSHDMEESHCPFYKKTYKDHTGGFCIAECEEDCRMVYIEEQDRYIHEELYQKQFCAKHEILREKHPIRQDLYCPKCKPQLVI